MLGKLRAADIPVSDNIDPHVRVNFRAKRRFGQCTKTRDGFVIELSSRLLDAPEHSARQTLAHELIHTCRGCMNHGRLFGKYAGRLNRLYGYNIGTTTSSRQLGIEPEKPKFVLVCTSCGQHFSRMRRCPLTDDPGRYRCACGGRLNFCDPGGE